MRRTLIQIAVLLMLLAGSALSVSASESPASRKERVLASITLADLALEGTTMGRKRAAIVRLPSGQLYPVNVGTQFADGYVLAIEQTEVEFCRVVKEVDGCAEKYILRFPTPVQRPDDE